MRADKWTKEEYAGDARSITPAMRRQEAVAKVLFMNMCSKGYSYQGILG